MNRYGRTIVILLCAVFCLVSRVSLAYQPQERVFDKLLFLASKQAEQQNKTILKIQQQYQPGQHVNKQDHATSGQVSAEKTEQTKE